MKKLLFLILPLVAVLLAGCSQGDDNLLRAVPEDAELLVRIDMRATAKSMGYTMMDLLKVVAKDNGKENDDCGIDLMGTAYIFMTDGKRQGGAVMPVRDADALRNFLTSNGIAVTETDGIYRAGRNIVFDETRLVMADGTTAAVSDLASLLRQEGVKDDVEELNEQLESIEDPIAIVMDGELIKKLSGGDIATSMALASVPVDLDDIYVLAGIDLTEKSLVLSTSVVAEDSEAQDQLEAIKKQLHPIKDGKIPFVADNYLALAALNLRGSDLKPYASILGGSDIGDRLDALNGLATFTLTGFDMQKTKPAFTLTAQATDMKCLDGLMEQYMGLGLPIRSEGKHTWTIADGQGDNILVGAQNGYIFVNYGNNMQRPKGDNTIRLEDGTVSYIRVLPSRIPELSSFGVDEVECYTTDELNVQATVKLSRTWKEIVEQLK